MARWLRKNSADAVIAMTALIMPEARPDSEPARATMQTSSGAGLGTAIRVRSTRIAISAVAVVRAGPGIARQSNCMPVSFATRVRGAFWRVGCVGGGLSRTILKARLTGSRRLSDLLAQMISNAPKWRPVRVTG